MRTFTKTIMAAAMGLAMVTSAYALPNVKILATGGTIAGTADSSTVLTGYKAGDLGIQVLINAVPQIKDYADVTGEQVVKISSNNMTDEILLNLAKRCNELLADPKINGLVITHGTDTLEETAFFLNLTVHSKKPIVLVGSMRPATAISADGPLNLLNAVKLAADPNAVGKGVMIAMNDVINGARDATKTNTTNVATFRSPDAGPLGIIAAGKNIFLHQPARRHTFNSQFDVSKLDKLPRVDIGYSHANADGVAIDAFVKAGAKGIVWAGTGNGSIHDDEDAAAFNAVKKGVIFMRSARVGSGSTTASDQIWTEHGYLESGPLNPQKARILLQLALTQTQDPAEIQKIFTEY